MSETIYESGEYLSKNPGWHAEHSSWKVRQIVRMLDTHRIRPQSVCEVGCGAGEILRCLQEELPAHCELTGYEISPQALDLARTRQNDRLTYHLGDVAEDPRHFDLMLVMDVIEHLEDYYSFLRKVRDHADRVIAHVPLDMCVNHLLRGKPLSDLRSVVGHIHSFTKDSALAAFRESGYQIVDCFYTTWAIEFPPRSWRRRVARYPRKIAYSINPDFTARVLGGFSLLVLAQPAQAV